MNGECSYYFDENDPSTWGPDEESAAYWQERYEELVGSVEREYEELKTKLADADGGEEVAKLKSELEENRNTLNKRRARLPLIGDDILVDGKWKCPHEAIRPGGRCIFHQSPSDKPEDADAEEVALLDALERASETKDPNYSRFIGANIRNIELKPGVYRRRGWDALGVGLPSQACLDFRYATVHNSLIAKGNSTEPFDFSRSVLISIIAVGEVSIRRCRLYQSFSADMSSFGHGNSSSRTSFEGTEFHDSATFEAARFSGETGDFSSVVFLGNGSGSFRDTEFLGKKSGSFNMAEFIAKGAGSFTNTKFVGEQSGSFDEAEFKGDFTFWSENANFSGPQSGSFLKTKFSGESAGWFEEAAFTGDGAGQFDQGEFTGEAAGSFDEANFTGNLSGSFVETIFVGGAAGSFREAKFTGDGAGRFSRAKFKGDGTGCFKDVWFTGSSIESLQPAAFSVTLVRKNNVLEFTTNSAACFKSAEFIGRNSGQFDNSRFIGRKSGDFSHTIFSGYSAGSFGPERPARFSLNSLACFEGARFVDVNFGNVEFGVGDVTAADGSGAVSDGETAIKSVRDSKVVTDEPADSGGGKDTEDYRIIPVSFESAYFGTANFDSTIFHRRVSFKGARFESESSFDATFERQVTFDGAIFDDNVRSIGMLPDLGSVDDRGHSFSHAEFRSRADLSGCGSLSGVNLQNAILHRTDLTGVDLSGAKLEGADLTASILDGATLRDTYLENTILESVHADNETFRRTFETNAERTVDSSWINYTCTYDPRRKLSQGNSSAEGGVTSADDGSTVADSAPVGHSDAEDGASPHADPDTEAESALEKDSNSRKASTSEDCIESAYRSVAVYQKLEQVARYNALSGPQAKLFLARKNVERLRYYHQIRTAESTDARLYALSLWLRSWAAKLVLNYGESPWRVIATSAFIVVFCALIYPLGFVRAVGGPPLSYGPTPSTWVPALFDSLYVSLLTFATADLGQFQPIGYGRLLVTAEASAGLVLFALLIFVFGRRAAR